MELTKKQEEGLRIAIERYKNKEKYTVISGFAGSGKSTLVRFIIEALGVDEDDVCYACYTGKAAEVLRKKGNKNCMTLHKMLYDSVPRIDGTFLRVPKRELDYKIIIVDECSMMPKQLADLLFSHRVYVICLGDPFQLPPINKDEDNHLLDHPHVFLDEIMRQAKESEIIRVSMDIREGRPISITDGSEVKVYSAASTPQSKILGIMNWADQTLVGTNAKRQALNNLMRQYLERGAMPEQGDKVICLKNYWETFGEDKNSLVNGTIGYIKNPVKSWIKLPRNICEGKNIDVLISDMISDSGELYRSLAMDPLMILEGKKTLDFKDEWKLSKQKGIGILPKEFAYAYAITVHKAQGSEWGKVLIIEEKFPFDKNEHARWLYTAITRSSEKCVIIR